MSKRAEQAFAEALVGVIEKTGGITFAKTIQPVKANGTTRLVLSGPQAEVDAKVVQITSKPVKGVRLPDNFGGFLIQVKDWKAATNNEMQPTK